MSVIGRLWRRAPAFRVAVAVAVASSALGAMFPPHLPASLLDRLRHRDRVPDERAHYTPVADAPPDYSLVDWRPLRNGRSVVIPFAGRQLPLPAGKWVEVALARDRETPPVQAVVLGRIQSGALTGMILVTGTPPVVLDARAPPEAIRCNDDTGQVIARQDCWNTGQLVTAQLRRPENAEMLLKKSLDQLDNLGVILPARLAAGSYARVDDSGALTMKLLLAEPAASAPTPAANRRMESWMRRWVPLLHRGFDGTLKPADVTAQLAHDPAAEPGPS